MAENCFRRFLIFFIVLCLSGHSFSVDSIYNVDDSNGYGRRFDGIGAISGGGATSKLLVNYPEQQRNEILDFLFKPNYGASIHILKVEIGGDAQSSAFEFTREVEKVYHKDQNGSEASHMHESWDENYQRGYEWWLMTEAKKRNPEILLFGLPWAFPAWIGNGTFDAYAIPEVTANYIIRWITGAKTHYNLTIDYIGIWNERNYSSTYIKVLRNALDAQGLQHVRICAPDDLGWQFAEAVLGDPELAAAVDFIGSHYPKTFSTEDAIKTGKQLWASEDHGDVNDNLGGACRAYMLNRNYINGQMTSTISWNLITSYYAGLPHVRAGIMTAFEPWSGNYIVEPPIWTTAHTTQFTKPGWRYLKHGSGVGNLTGGGSYVAFTDQEAKELTIIVETVNCPVPFSASDGDATDQFNTATSYGALTQNIAFKLSGSFVNVKLLYVWYSRISSGDDTSTLFMKMPPVQVVDGTVKLSVGVNEVYTLTTVSTGNKGTAPILHPHSPSHCRIKTVLTYIPPYEPDNLAQQVGVWEVVEVGPPRGNVIRQIVYQHPVYWCWGGGVHPKNTTLNVIGNYNWSNIYVQVDARVSEVNGSEGVFVAARAERGGCRVSYSQGIFFFIYPKEQRFLLTNDLERLTVIHSGPAVVSDSWNTLALLVMDNTAVGMANGKLLFNVSIPSQPAHGFVGLGTVPYGMADFDNLQILNSAEGFKLIKREDGSSSKLFYKPEK